MLNFYIADEFLYTIPHRTIHMTAKMKCGAVMVLAKQYTAPHRTCDRKNEVRCSYDFG